MTVTIKHNKVSTVPDTADTSLVRPSDWNADHTVVGLGTAAELNAGQPNGVATLDSTGKVPTSQIPLQGDLNYQGAWNASTNTPTLASGVGTKGYYYVVSVAGTTNLDGITDWQVGDWAIFNGSIWQKVDNTDAVTSVNGQVGTVVLTTTNIAEGTNQYFTQARARQSLSAGTGISYDNTTGVITNSSPSLGGDVVGPASATDNAIARFDTTTGKLIQNSVVTVSDTGAMTGVSHITDIDYVDFNTSYATTLGAGQLGWDGNNTLGLGMSGGNIIQQIGLQTLIYGKASSAITKGQLIKKTGANGSSGVITFAPTTANMTNSSDIIGIAAEDIVLNGFGYIISTGNLKGINTSGSGSGETWADGDVLYYNPSGNGLMTNVKPSAPNIKTEVAIVTNAGSGGSGSVVVEIIHGSVLGGTDSNVQINSVTGGQLLSYDQTNGYWKNTNLAAGTGVSVNSATGGVITVTNTAPDQTVSISAGTGINTSGTYPNFTITNSAPDQTVVLNAGTGISVSGTYPNFTVTNTSPSSGGTVTSVDVSGGTTGLTTSGGPVTGSGTITLAGTLGVANGGTGLTSLTANRIPYGNGTSALGNEADFTYDPSLNTVTAPQVMASNGIIVNSATISANYTIPSGSNAMSAGPVTVASGITVTVTDGAWVIV